MSEHQAYIRGMTTAILESIKSSTEQWVLMIDGLIEIAMNMEEVPKEDAEELLLLKKITQQESDKLVEEIEVYMGERFGQCKSTNSTSSPKQNRRTSTA